ncbi:hypothetical protein L208DRAFT_1414799, partial [Tricholoma matsutake]
WVVRLVIVILFKQKSSIVFFLVERLSPKLRSTPTTDKVSMEGRTELGKSLLKT